MNPQAWFACAGMLWAASVIADQPPRNWSELLHAAGRDGDSVTSWNEISVPGAVVLTCPDGLLFDVTDAASARVLRLPRLACRVKAATIVRPLAEDRPFAATALRAADVVKFTQSPREWSLELPADASGRVLVALDLYDPPAVASPSHVAEPDRDGTVTLVAHRAVVHGEKLQYEPLPHKNTVGYWVNPADWCHWQFRVPQTGAWRVQILQGCGRGQGGSEVDVVIGDQQLPYVVAETGHFQNFVWRDVGQVSFPEAGESSLRLQVRRLAHKAVMDVRQIRLSPAAGAGPNADATGRDIRDVQPDVLLPPLWDAPPAAGRRVCRTTTGYEHTAVQHTLWLPVDWNDQQTWPVIVELTGNGGYQNSWGDRCTGRVADASLAFGATAGQGCLIVSLPYLNAAATANVEQWWGDAPAHDPQPTLDYLRRTVEETCRLYRGDPQRVLLAGFSRGALACNYLGLHDDQTARLWKAFLVYSHYDGVREHWPYPHADRAAALARLARLNGRAQFICCEDGAAGVNLAEVRTWLADQSQQGEFTFASTGFVNHNDAWTLRPSPARAQLRDWLAAQIGLAF